MKKTSHFFWILAAFWFGALGGIAFCSAEISGVLCATVVIIGAGAWAVIFARFRSVKYTVENSTLIIRRGIFFRTEISLKVSKILWITVVKISSITLFTVLHTVSGRILIFAELDPALLPEDLKKTRF